MNRSRILEILEAYRPGEGLESDPEIRQALDEAAQDPELSEIQRNIAQSKKMDKLKRKSHLFGIISPREKMLA